MWNSIASLETIIKEPWLLMGDFNAIRYGNEKLGGASIKMSSAQDFNHCVDSSALLELHQGDPPFTWTNSTIGHSRIECRLDRAFIIKPSIKVQVTSEAALSTPPYLITGLFSSKIKMRLFLGLLLDISMLGPRRITSSQWFGMLGASTSQALLFSEL